MRFYNLSITTEEFLHVFNKEIRELYKKRLINSTHVYLLCVAEKIKRVE